MTHTNIPTNDAHNTHASAHTHTHICTNTTYSYTTYTRMHTWCTQAHNCTHTQTYMRRAYNTYTHACTYNTLDFYTSTLVYVSVIISAVIHSNIHIDIHYVRILAHARTYTQAQDAHMTHRHSLYMRVTNANAMYIYAGPSLFMFHIPLLIYIHVPVRPRPANKLCPLNFSISTCINFHLKNKKKSLQHVNIVNVELRYFIFQSVKYDIYFDYRYC